MPERNHLTQPNSAFHTSGTGTFVVATQAADLTVVLGPPTPSTGLSGAS